MEKYQVQLEQVNSSLAKTPNNDQLLLLKSKLIQLLNLKCDVENKCDSFSRIQGHTTDFPLQVGEACEIFDESLKYWRSGNIVSMTLERDFYIVAMKKKDTTQRVPSVHVRRPVYREKSTKAKQDTRTVQKPQLFKLRKPQPEPEGPNKWKTFTDKMMKK